MRTNLQPSSLAISGLAFPPLLVPLFAKILSTWIFIPYVPKILVIVLKKTLLPFEPSPLHSNKHCSSVLPVNVYPTLFCMYSITSSLSNKSCRYLSHKVGSCSISTSMFVFLDINKSFLCGIISPVLRLTTPLKVLSKYLSLFKSLFKIGAKCFASSTIAFFPAFDATLLMFWLSIFI